MTEIRLTLLTDWVVVGECAYVRVRRAAPLLGEQRPAAPEAER
jgi:hypothetical protein